MTRNANRVLGDCICVFRQHIMHIVQVGRVMNGSNKHLLNAYSLYLTVRSDIPNTYLRTADNGEFQALVKSVCPRLVEKLIR